jgi:hypothetical protein
MTKNRIVVVVRGGLVTAVYADKPEALDLYVRDLDNIQAGDDDVPVAIRRICTRTHQILLHE